MSSKRQPIYEIELTYIVFDILGFDCFVRGIGRIQRSEGHLERLVDNRTHLSRCDQAGSHVISHCIENTSRDSHSELNGALTDRGTGGPGGRPPPPPQGLNIGVFFNLNTKLLALLY